MRRLIQIVGLVACVGLLPALGQLTPLSDSMTVFDPTGAIYDQLLLFEDGSMSCIGPCSQTGPGNIGEDPNSIYFINDPNLVDTGQFGLATTLTDPDGSYSDIFGIAGVTGTEFLAFTSDSDRLPAAFGAQGFYFLPEGNGPVDATAYLASNLQSAGYTAQFRSDVPEPGTLSLLAGGIMMLAWSLRRRARS